MFDRSAVLCRWNPKNRRWFWLLSAGFSACASVGCASITSTMLTRDFANSQWERSTSQGIPITLKVPTHLKLYIYDKHFLEFANSDQTQIQPVKMDVPVRDFASEFMYTDKVFTVDFKRPAAGAFNLRLAMSNEQYFSQIQHDVTDQTIGDVTTLLGDLLKTSGSVPQVSGGGGGAADPPNISEIKSLVAVGVFEIADPNFQKAVFDFVNCHINNAHDAWNVPPGVTAFHRVGSDACSGLSGPYQANPLGMVDHQPENLVRTASSAAPSQAAISMAGPQKGVSYMIKR